MKTALLTFFAAIAVLTITSHAADKTVLIPIDRPVFTAPVYVTDTTQALKIKALELQVQSLTSELETKKQLLKFSQLEVKTLPETRKEIEGLKVTIAEQKAWMDDAEKQYNSLANKYKSLVLRWNTQQNSIAQQNAVMPATPVSRGNTEAQETLEGIKFQLQQIQVENMGREDRAKYGY